MNISKNYNGKELTLSIEGRIDTITSQDLDKEINEELGNFDSLISYSKTEFITVNVEYSNPTLTIEFIDNGIEFNPLLAKNPTPPANIDEAQIGGLGIYLTKEIADELYYHYINGENHLKILKNVE